MKEIMSKIPMWGCICQFTLELNIRVTLPKIIFLLVSFTVCIYRRNFVSSEREKSSSSQWILLFQLRFRISPSLFYLRTLISSTPPKSPPQLLRLRRLIFGPRCHRWKSLSNSPKPLSLRSQLSSLEMEEKFLLALTIITTDYRQTSSSATVFVVLLLLPSSTPPFFIPFTTPTL